MRDEVDDLTPLWEQLRAVTKFNRFLGWQRKAKLLNLIDSLILSTVKKLTTLQQLREAIAKETS
jgi:hypothetical protein